MILIIKKHTTQNTHSPSPSDTHVAILNAKIQNYTLKIALNLQNHFNMFSWDLFYVPYS